MMTSSALYGEAAKEQTASFLPKIGAFVTYVLSSADAAEINKKIVSAKERFYLHRAFELGFSAPIGNHAREGQELPMLVIRTWDTSVNGQVFVDGNFSFWATSVTQGSVPGTWH